MYDFYRFISDWGDYNPIRGKKVFYDTTIKYGQIEIKDIVATEAQDFKVNKDLFVINDTTIKGDLYIDKTVFAKRYEYGQIFVQDTTVKQDLYVDRNLSVARSAQVNKNITIKNDATVKGDIRVDGIIFGTVDNISTNEAQDFKVNKDLIVQDDATIKDNLYVDGIIFGTVDNISTNEAQDFKVNKDLIVQDDSTVKDDLRVEGNVFITGSIEAGSGLGGGSGDGAANFRVFSNLVAEDTTLRNRLEVGGDGLFRQRLLVYDDATVKGNLYINKNADFEVNDIFIRNDATIKGDLKVDGQTRLEMDNLFLSGDATIKDDLRVEGIIFGTLGSEARDLKVLKDLLVQHDTTIKQDLRIEGRLIAGSPLKVDQGIVIRKDDEDIDLLEEITSLKEEIRLLKRKLDI